MFRWFRHLMPREDKFFEMFARHADQILRGAEELRAMLNGGDAVRRHYPAVLAAEDEADAIVRCAHLLREAVPLLVRMSPNSGRINELCEQIRRVEGDADDIHEAGMIDLYRRCQPDGVLRFIAAREVLDQLERIVDRFDDAANEIEGIVVEHV